jgi:molybdopterin-guanine dinucleotide biosynthesis protein A
MRKSAIILAGGVSKRFGQVKALVQIVGRPLISRVSERAREAVEEVIVVVSSSDQMESYESLFPEKTRIVVDVEDSHSPLVGALTGFMNVHGDYSILLPSDTPFVSKEVVKLLFDISLNMDAVIPRWPNGYIEPLQAVYRTSSALAATREVVSKGETRLQSMIYLLRRVRYLSTMVIREIDPHLDTFFNINTPSDLKRAEKLIEKRFGQA